MDKTGSHIACRFEEGGGKVSFPSRLFRSEGAEQAVMVLQKDLLGRTGGVLAMPNTYRLGRRGGVVQDYIMIVRDRDFPSLGLNCRWVATPEILKTPKQALGLRVHERVQGALAAAGMALHESHPGTPRSRLKRRGAGAWEISMHPQQLVVGKVNRLIAHLVQDETGLHAYAPAARRFLDFCAEWGMPVMYVHQRDASLADYLAYMCFEEDRGLESGRVCVAAVSVIFPEMSHRTPFADLALKSWQRLHVGGEGAPTTWVILCAVTQEMRRLGYFQSADVVEMAADGYLRSSDWAQVNKEDIVGPYSDAHPHRIAIMLGIGERGEATKTGSKQGVRPDRSGISRMWNSYRELAKPGGRVFQVTPPVVRNHWDEAQVSIGVEAGPLHTVRHVGPSTDMHNFQDDPYDDDWTGPYRTIDQLRTRGRWRAKTSVLRYGKTFSLLKVASKVSPEVLASGKARLLQLGTRPRRALE